MGHLLRQAAVVAALLLGPGQPAWASSFLFEWIGVNGSAIGATSVVTLAASDTAVLEIQVVADSNGVTAAAVSVDWEPASLQLTDFEVCPAGTGNTTAMFCGDLFGVGGVASLLQPFSPLVIDNVNGVLGSVTALTPNSPGQVDHVFALAHVTFHSSGGATPVSPFFNPATDGIGDSLFNLDAMPDAFGALVIPEPGTALLVGLGLAALAASARRRR